MIETLNMETFIVIVHLRVYSCSSISVQITSLVKTLLLKVRSDQEVENPGFWFLIVEFQELQARSKHTGSEIVLSPARDRNNRCKREYSS